MESRPYLIWPLVLGVALRCPAPARACRPGANSDTKTISRQRPQVRNLWRHWPRAARLALVELCAGVEAQDENVGVKLLNAFRDIFQEKNVKHISTKEALESLIARENDEPWAAWWEKDFKNDGVRSVAGKMARLLKPFGIVTGSIREADGSTPKGYKLESFEDAFSRYLTENTP